MSSFAVNLLDVETFLSPGVPGYFQGNSIGPFKHEASGSLYLFAYGFQTTGSGTYRVVAAKSIDGGITWAVVDEGNSPETINFDSGYHTATDYRIQAYQNPSNGKIWVGYWDVTQDTTYPVALTFVEFDPSTDTWGLSTQTPDAELRSNGGPVYNPSDPYTPDVLNWNGRFTENGRFYLCGPFFADPYENVEGVPIKSCLRVGFTYIDSIGGAWASPTRIPGQPVAPDNDFVEVDYPDNTVSSMLSVPDGRVFQFLLINTFDGLIPADGFQAVFLVDDGNGSPGASSEEIVTSGLEQFSVENSTWATSEGGYDLLVMGSYYNAEIAASGFGYTYSSSQDSPSWDSGTVLFEENSPSYGIGTDVDGTAYWIYYEFDPSRTLISRAWGGSGFNEAVEYAVSGGEESVPYSSVLAIASLGMAGAGSVSDPSASFPSLSMGILSPSPGPATASPVAPEHPLAKPIFRCPNFWDFCLGTLHAQESGVKLPPPFTPPADWVPPACYDQGQPWLQIPSQGRELYQLGSLVLPAPGSGDQLLFSYRVPVGYYAVLYEIYQDYTEPFTSTAGQLIWRVRLNRRWIKDMGSMDYALGSLNGFKCLDDRIIADSGWTVSYFVNVPSTSPLVGGRVLAGLRGWVYPYGV